MLLAMLVMMHVFVVLKLVVNGIETGLIVLFILVITAQSLHDDDQVAQLEWCEQAGFAG